MTTSYHKKTLTVGALLDSTKKSTLICRPELPRASLHGLGREQPPVPHPQRGPWPLHIILPPHQSQVCQGGNNHLTFTIFQLIELTYLYCYYAIIIIHSLFVSTKIGFAILFLIELVHHLGPPLLRSTFVMSKKIITRVRGRRYFSCFLPVKELRIIC